MKKVLIITAYLLSFTLISYSQERELMIIEPTMGNNEGNDNSPFRMFCAIFESSFEFGCANVTGKCENASGTHTIIIQAQVCVDRLVGTNPGNGPIEKMQLFDVIYNFIPNGEPINVVEFNKLKNESITISSDVILKFDEIDAIIKAGTYKVNNSKMHTKITQTKK